MPLRIGRNSSLGGPAILTRTSPEEIALPEMRCAGQSLLLTLERQIYKLRALVSGAKSEA